VDVLLREVRTRPDGVTEYDDTEVTADEISIGSAPDQIVQLLGSGIGRHHAVLRGSSGRFRIGCVDKGRVTVNGKDVRSAALGVGDRMELGGHRLVLIEAPAGFDLGVEIHRNVDVQNSAFEAAFRTSLAETWLGKRRPAWLLLVVVLVVTLVVPLLLLESSNDSTADEATTPRTLSAARLAVAARSQPIVPTDRLWSTGPLLPAHQLAIGDDCSSCHAKLFERVQDVACKKCHEVIHDHVTPERSELLALETHRCATCHLEHNEPPSLVVRADSLCTHCHANPDAWRPRVELDPVQGFTADTHPAFDVFLLRAAESAAGSGLEFDWNVHIESVATAREQSHLKFPHDKHLNDVFKADQTPLGCTDCHTLSPDQEHFLPVTMKDHCRSCHDLRFDPDDSRRELPHGDTREAILTLEGHFMRKFADPNAAAEDDSHGPIPGVVRRSQKCAGSVFQCGRERAEVIAEQQFTQRGCAYCHDVNDTHATDLVSRFQVYPIRLQSDYYPLARFDHVSHLTQRDKSGDDACLSCHDARSADSSDVVLVPDIDNCLQCHDAGKSGQIVEQCIDCHAYHPLKSRARPKEVEDTAS
jgi:predicted CXXCH cytochrome family protein